jgi:hypothetical protein
MYYELIRSVNENIRSSLILPWRLMASAPEAMLRKSASRGTHNQLSQELLRVAGGERRVADCLGFVGTGTLLTLTVLPAVYSWLEGRRRADAYLPSAWIADGLQRSQRRIN